MKIFNNNTELVFLDTNSSIFEGSGNTEEYFQNARLKFLFLFYFLCVHVETKICLKYKYFPKRDIMVQNSYSIIPILENYKMPLF